RGSANVEAAFAKLALRAAVGVLREIEDVAGGNRRDASLAQCRLEVFERTGAATSNHRNGCRLIDTANQREIEAVASAVPIDRVEEDLPCPAIDDLAHPLVEL